MVGLVDTEKGADCGGFARAVATEEAENLAFLDFEREIFDNGFAIESDGEVFYFDKR